MLSLVEPRMLLTFFALWVHCWFMSNWGSTRIPWILFCKADIQLARLQPVLMHWVILLHMQDFVLPFTEHHEDQVGQFMQPVESL